MHFEEREVEYLATLARLSLSKDEQVRMQKDLASILEFVGTLKKSDAADIEYRYPVEGLVNANADDEVLPSGEEVRSGLLASMPDRAGDLLKVKGVFDTGEEKL